MTNAASVEELYATEYMNERKEESITNSFNKTKSESSKRKPISFYSLTCCFGLSAAC
jgi:hypothetical protein